MLCVTKSQTLDCFKFLREQNNVMSCQLCTYFGNFTGSSSLERVCGQTPQAVKSHKWDMSGYPNEAAKSGRQTRES